MTMLFSSRYLTACTSDCGRKELFFEDKPGPEFQVIPALLLKRAGQSFCLQILASFIMFSSLSFSPVKRNRHFLFRRRGGDHSTPNGFFS